VHNSDISGKLGHMEDEKMIEPDETVTIGSDTIGHCPVCDAYFSIVPGGHFDLPERFHESPAMAE
jgi:hypothetical protein